MERDEKPSPMAEAIPLINIAKAMTSERMLTGALENAYSRLVMEANISDMPIRT